MWDIAKKFLRLQTTTVEERRREIREQVTGGDAFIDGRKYPLNNWSASGYSVGPCTLVPRMGSRIEIEFHVPLPDQELQFKTLCLVVRHVSSGGLFAGIFLGVDAETRVIMDQHFEVLTEESLRREVEEGLRDTKERIGEAADRIKKKTLK